MTKITALPPDSVPTTTDYITTVDTETGLNKRVLLSDLKTQLGLVMRETTTASNATPTPNADTTDIYTVTALATAPTFGAPTGSPVQGQKLIIRIKDNGTARVLAWNAIYRNLGTALPTTTVISKTLYCGFIYNATDTKWDLVALSQEA